MHPSPVQRLQNFLRGRRLDGFLVTQPENRRYLSRYSAPDHGIQESAGALLIPRQGTPYLLTDSRFALQAEEESSGFLVHIYRKGLLPSLKELLPGLGIRRLGFESHYTLHETYLRLERMARQSGISLFPLAGQVERLRCVKREEEISALRESVRLNERVFQLVYNTIEPGMSEREVALALELTMRELGAEGPSFPPIVAFGTNSARPHAVPGERILRTGDIVLIDMGLILNGYCSDMTRTVVVGTPDNTFLRRLRTVRKAQQAAISAIRHGAVCRDVDRAARRVIRDAGYGKYFGHALGHGVGLAVHEDPRLSAASRKKLRSGMVVTVEPGIYLPDWGGIRLENMLVVREKEAELLNSDTTGLDL